VVRKLYSQIHRKRQSILQPDKTTRATQLIASRHDLLLDTASHILRYETRADSYARNVLIDHDICNSSVPCMDDGCHGFRADKQLAATCLH